MLRTYNTNVRSRSHFIRSYWTKEELDVLLSKNLSLIYRYAFIFHDKDKKDDGTLKPKHVHVWVKFKEKRSTFNVEKLFTILDCNNRVVNVESQLCVSDYVAQRYLIHLDDPDKYQYGVEEVTSFNLDYERCLDFASKPKDTSIQIVHDILDGVDALTLLHRYGTFFVLNRKKFYDLTAQIKDERYSSSYNTVHSIICNDTGELLTLKTVDVKEFKKNLRKLEDI